MVRAPSFAGVILAAGESSRMGRDKALLAWQGRTFLEAHIVALQMHTDFVLAVGGRNSSSLQPFVDAQAAFLVQNPAPERGQFSSLQVGLREVLNRGRDAAIIALVDRPPARPETIASLRRAFEASPRDVWAVVPECEGRHGHPLVAGREMIEAFLSASSGTTARDVEHAYRQHILYVPVADPLVVANINTPEEYRHIAP
jgi:CTP:molybdopterin cytidylyltransferase MocA